jgi:Ca2+-binding EF-hand superfamily protein
MFLEGTDNIEEIIEMFNKLYDSIISKNADKDETHKLILEFINDKNNNITFEEFIKIMISVFSLLEEYEKCEKLKTFI